MVFRTRSLVKYHRIIVMCVTDISYCLSFKTRKLLTPGTGLRSSMDTYTRRYYMLNILYRKVFKWTHPKMKERERDVCMFNYTTAIQTLYKLLITKYVPTSMHIRI